jgi:tetratricopeptide (TPR) repeat protein
MLARLSIALIVLSLILLPACAVHTPVETLRERGDAHFARGEHDRAAEQYSQITDRYPGDWEAQYRLGVSLLELDEPSEARRALEMAHSHRPGHDGIANALAEAMFRLGDERQLFAFLRERADSRQSPAAHLHLAHYAMEMGDPDSAQVAINKAIVLDDGRSVVPYLAAAALAERLGDMDLAVRRLRQAYGINPLDERVRTRLRELGEVPGPTLALPPGR